MTESNLHYLFKEHKQRSNTEIINKVQRNREHWNKIIDKEICTEYSSKTVIIFSKWCKLIKLVLITYEYMLDICHFTAIANEFEAYWLIDWSIWMACQLI